MARMLIQSETGGSKFLPNDRMWMETHELEADYVAELIEMLPDPAPRAVIDGWTYYMKPNGLFVRTKEV